MEVDYALNCTAAAGSKKSDGRPGLGRHWYYDRIYDRKIDNSKVSKATGLKPEDFKSIEEGIRSELKKLNVIK